MNSSRIVLIAFGLVMIAGSALAQSRAIAIEPSPEVVAPPTAPGPAVPPAPVVEAPKAPAEAPVAAAPAVEEPTEKIVPAPAPAVKKRVHQPDYYRRREADYPPHRYGPPPSSYQY